MDTWTNREKQIAAALQETTGVWTPECLDPDDLIGLIEEGGQYPGAASLMAHVTECPYCRNAYREMGVTLTDAARARMQQQKPHVEKPVLTEFPMAVDSVRHHSLPAMSEVGRGQGWWKRLTGPGLGFAFAAAASLVLFLSSVEPEIEQQQRARAQALVERNHARQALTAKMQERKLLVHEIEALRARTAAQDKARGNVDAQNRKLLAAVEVNRREAERLRAQVKNMRVPPQGPLLARLEQEDMRIPAAIAGIDRQFLRGDSAETEIQVIGPSGQRVLTPHTVLRWKPLDAEARYRLRVLDPRNHVTAEGTTDRSEWTLPGSLPRGVALRWQVEAMRPGDEEIMARSGLASFLILDTRKAEELQRAQLELGARYLAAGLAAEAEHAAQSVLDADPTNRAARQLLDRAKAERSGQ